MLLGQGRGEVSRGAEACFSVDSNGCPSAVPSPLVLCWRPGNVTVSILVWPGSGDGKVTERIRVDRDQTSVASPYSRVRRQR